MPKVNGVAIYNGKQVILDTPFRIDPGPNYGNDWGVFTLSENDVPIFLKFKTPDANFASEDPGKAWTAKYWMCWLVNKKLTEKPAMNESPDYTKTPDGRMVVWSGSDVVFGFLPSSNLILVSSYGGWTTHGALLERLIGRDTVNTSKPISKVELSLINKQLNDGHEARQIMSPAGRLWKGKTKIVSFWERANKVTKQHIQLVVSELGVTNDYLLEFMDSTDASRLTVGEFMTGQSPDSKNLSSAKFEELMKKKHLGQLTSSESAAVKKIIKGFGSVKSVALAKHTGYDSVAAMNAVKTLSEDLIQIVSQVVTDAVSIESLPDVGSTGVKIITKTTSDAERYYVELSKIDGIRPLYYDEKIIVVKQDSEVSPLLVD